MMKKKRQTPQFGCYFYTTPFENSDEWLSRLDHVAPACVTSTGLIPANAAQALSKWYHTITWNCCQVKILGIYCVAGGALSEREVSQRKQKPVLLVSAWNLQREMKRGAARQQSVGGWHNVGGGDGRVHVCLGSILSAWAQITSDTHDWMHFGNGWLSLRQISIAVRTQLPNF